MKKIKNFFLKYRFYIGIIWCILIFITLSIIQIEMDYNARVEAFKKGERYAIKTYKKIVKEDLCRCGNKTEREICFRIYKDLLKKKLNKN